ncbi:hypothetical protein G5S34_17515 [Herbaspirillum frisingense]|uniref:hypothetical protein n=1 Tax=Herbaspirillum frisingense TaxID=92645 RepID=UPI0016035518|nr:hypothetical protein [Herbaspirillum frisingense]QNB08372.1 hypothetical protein G5S34_17515 [Herbaspirillum frisingense]
MQKDFQPLCRYGHGALIKDQLGPSQFWGLMGAIVRETPPKTLLGQTTETVSSGVLFTVNLYRCKVCGYIELFDDSFDHG